MRLLTWAAAVIMGLMTSSVFAGPVVVDQARAQAQVKDVYDQLLIIQQQLQGNPVMQKKLGPNMRRAQDALAILQQDLQQAPALAGGRPVLDAEGRVIQVLADKVEDRPGAGNPPHPPGGSTRPDSPRPGAGGAGQSGTSQPPPVVVVTPPPRPATNPPPAVTPPPVVVVVQPPTPPTPPPPAPVARAATEESMQNILGAISRESFSADKLRVLSQATQGKYFTAGQLVRLLEVFSFENDKIEALRRLAPGLLDRENAYTIYGAFTYSSSKAEAEKILNGR